MIPSSPHLGSAIRRHRLAIRRSAAVLAAALVIGAAPLVARALDDESVPTAGVVDSPSALPEARPVGNPTVQSLIGPQVPTVPDLGDELPPVHVDADEVAGGDPRDIHPDTSAANISSAGRST